MRQGSHRNGYAGLSRGLTGFLTFIRHVGVGVGVKRGGMWSFGCCPINPTAALTVCMIRCAKTQRIVNFCVENYNVTC